MKKTSGNIIDTNSGAVVIIKNEKRNSEEKSR